jgi:hypothetical protein
MVHVFVRSVAVPLGMAAGYLVWLTGMTVLTATVPVPHMIFAASALLGSITIAAFVLGLQFKASGRRLVARAFWFAPVLPMVASVYSLIVFLH